MSGNHPRKKLDFFNGGRGVDLSQYEREEERDYMGTSSMEEEETSNGGDTYPPLDSYSGEASPNFSPSPSEPQSTSSWNDYNNPSVSFNPEPPTHYVNKPTPSYFPPMHSFDPNPHVTHNSAPLAPSLQAAAGVLHHHPHQAIPPIHPVHTSSFPPPHSLFAEPSYGSYMSPSTYSTFRPMDASGLHGISMGYGATPQGVECAVAGHGGMRGGESGRKKRQQKCSLCSNHNIQNDVKGHKWFCPYRDCQCDRCIITRGRQHHMKEQQKLTRHLQRLQ